jgi:hypothetical protein
MPVLGVVIDMKSGARSGLLRACHVAEIGSANFTSTVAYKSKDNDVGYRVVRRVD